jgi:uncharacterized membrane protein YgaE (UPF0421/DUF939 family)
LNQFLFFVTGKIDYSYVVVVFLIQLHKMEYESDNFIIVCLLLVAIIYLLLENSYSMKEYEKRVIAEYEEILYRKNQELKEQKQQKMDSDLDSESDLDSDLDSDSDYVDLDTEEKEEEEEKQNSIIIQKHEFHLSE